MQERRVLPPQNDLAATDVGGEAEGGDDQHRVAEHVSAGDHALDRHLILLGSFFLPEEIQGAREPTLKRE
jgi:hypothetical protein